MAQDDDGPSSGQGSPKRKTLNLDLLFGPVTSVPTSVGTVYLYALRASDYEVLENLTEAEPPARFRVLLPCIASLVETKGSKEERQPVRPAEVGRLTDSDLDALADAYAVTLLRRVRAIGNTREDPPQREPGEASAAYVDRLLKHEVRVQLDELRKMRETMLASTGDIFDQVRKSSSALGSTLSAYERLTSDTASVAVPVPRVENFHPIYEHHARQARERAEELEMVRLTGKMTAESAQTLKDLAEAATVMLERLDARDQKSDQSTRKQINIAVWSVGISAVIAVVALVVSGLAYFQDKTSSETGDKLQAKLLEAVQEGNRQQSALQQENHRLRTQVSELEAQVAHFDTRTGTKIEKRPDSDGRRATRRGSAALQP